MVRLSFNIVRKCDSLLSRYHCHDLVTLQDTNKNLSVCSYDQRLALENESGVCPPHYGLMTHMRDSFQCNEDSPHSDAGRYGASKVTQIDHLDKSIPPSRSLNGLQNLDFVNWISGNSLHYIRPVVSGKMRKTMMMLSPLGFATRVSAVADSGSCQNLISPSVTAGLGLESYTEAFQDTQNFLISVESPSSHLKPQNLTF